MEGLALILMAGDWSGCCWLKVEVSVAVFKIRQQWSLLHQLISFHKQFLCGKQCCLIAFYLQWWTSFKIEVISPQTLPLLLSTKLYKFKSLVVIATVFIAPPWSGFRPRKTLASIRRGTYSWRFYHEIIAFSHIFQAPFLILVLLLLNNKTWGSN